MRQWNQTQDVSHATLVTRVMGREVVLHVILMSVVLRTSHLLLHPTVRGVMIMEMDVGSVQKGITSMMLMVHVNNVRRTHVVQDTLIIIPVPLAVMNVQVTK